MELAFDKREFLFLDFQFFQLRVELLYPIGAVGDFLLDRRDLGVPFSFVLEQAPRVLADFFNVFFLIAKHVDFVLIILDEKVDGVYFVLVLHVFLE